MSEIDLSILEKNLINKGYTVKIFDDVISANEYLATNIQNKTVGIGGSMTIEEMKTTDLLKVNNTIFWHWHKNENETQDEILLKAQQSDIYLSSVNGMSEDGQIINIDGTSNRISSVLYGHQQVYFILGINKITKTYEEALDRSKNIAAVKNAIRLHKETPCTKLGKCIDCKHSQRICRSLCVLWEKPDSCPFEVIIIKQELGY